MFGSPTADRFGAQRACRRVSRMPAAAPTPSEVASCVGEGSITPELWVNGVKAVDGATWGCSIELPAAVNVDSAMPRLQSSDEVQIRFKELWSNQEAWAVLEPAYPSEE